LAQEIAAGYQKYLRNPQVDVFVREYQSQPVAVIGAVNTPGRFQLQRRVRLLELISFAGGPGELAGRSIQLIHATSASPACETPHADASVGAVEAGVVSYDLSATLRAEDSANPYVRPGDIVTLPEAEQAFVVGNVLRPGPITLKESITVTQAIARVGGTLPDTKSERVRITRQASGRKTELYVDLKAINTHQAEDLALQANDIVDVPTASGRRFLRTLTGAIAPTLGRLPVRVVH
jgi:polysaccharide export outer membrane protein